jgi:hypothetical protein
VGLRGDRTHGGVCRLPRERAGLHRRDDLVAEQRFGRETTPPFGNFELISGSSTLEGWTADMDVPDQPISVNVYINGPVGVGTLFASFTASAPRPDLTAAFGIPGNHRFVPTLPSCPHGAMLYAYGLDPESNGDGSSFIGAHACP